MKRTLWMLLAVLLLGGGAWWMTQMQEDKATSLAGADRAFAVPREQVFKVFLADRNGNKTTLTREKDGWRYNGKHKARPDAIENLLSAIDQVQMRFKPSDAAVPNMVKTLASHGIKVEIYGKNDDLLKAYYIGGGTSDERGTHIIIEGAEQPYVAELPNWEGNIRFRYSLIGDDWRDRTLFGCPYEKVALVSVEYPKQQDKSFVVDFRSNSAGEVVPFYPLSPRKQAPLKPGSLDAFRGNFESVIAAGFNNENREKTAILQQVPFAVITLEDTDQQRVSVTLFPIYPKPFTDPKTGVTIQPEEVTSYYAYTQDDDFMIVQDQVIGKVLWAYDFFFAE
ncbi:MAG: hypothetical protein R2795_10575 [Saprospiraceae bacterium]